MSSKYPTVKQWAHKRVIPVDLEDDLRVDFRLPDLGVWIAAGRIPNPLKAIAERLEYQGFDPQELDDEERVQYYDLQCFVVAHHVVKPNLVEDLGEEQAVEWVRDEMPPHHRQKLWLSGFHVSPELGETLLELAKFREERPGAESPDDSEELGQAAE